MIIKKYQGNTESEAILRAKEELGSEAIVTNVKKILPKGLGRLFCKPTFEITAALDETPPKQEHNRKDAMRALFKDNPGIIFDDEEEKKEQPGKAADTSAIEIKLNNLTDMIEKRMVDPSATARSDDKKRDTDSDKNVDCLRLIYNQLTDNEVDEKYINQIISEIEPTLKKDTSVDVILSAIYQKIVLKLGKTEVLDVTPGKVKYVFFIGPTGVGKTTTIAKLASKLKLDKKLNVALLTADTYRIAAVEQLHTYANILQIPLKVAYNETELAEASRDMSSYDIVLVDTAGRSHRDKQQRDDIDKLIRSIPEDQREVFLVLSVTTKYKDLIRITEAYSEIADYRLIFTKLDETTCLGNIFNIRMLTGAPLSYATFGQTVPNDISRVNPQMIAKQLLGGDR